MPITYRDTYPTCIAPYSPYKTTVGIKFSQIFLFIESCRPIVGTVGCNVGWVGVSIGYRHTIVSCIGVLNPRVSFKGAP